MPFRNPLESVAHFGKRGRTASSLEPRGGGSIFRSPLGFLWIRNQVYHPAFRRFGFSPISQSIKFCGTRPFSHSYLTRRSFTFGAVTSASPPISPTQLSPAR